MFNFGTIWGRVLRLYALTNVSLEEQSQYSLVRRMSEVHSRSKSYNLRVTNWKIIIRKVLSPNLRHHAGIYMEGLREISIRQNSRSKGRDLNSVPLEYKAGVLITLA
jgi:hypothetical protein